MQLQLPGAAERDEAIDRTTDGNERWLAAVSDAIEHVASHRREFTTDHVWARLADGSTEPPPGFEPRAMGAAMVRAMRAGIIERTDRTEPTDRPEAHRSPKRIWRSVILTGEAKAVENDRGRQPTTWIAVANLLPGIDRLGRVIEEQIRLRGESIGPCAGIDGRSPIADAWLDVRDQLAEIDRSALR